MMAKKNAISENEVVYKGNANHIVGIEGVGGKLFLTEDELIFKAHRLNIQKKEYRISVKNIGEFNTPFFLPTAMTFRDDQGKKEKFIVYGRKKWIEKIEEQKRKVGGN